VTSRRGGIRIFGGTSHPALLLAVCRYLELEPGRVELHQFPNENLFVRFPDDFSDQDVFLVQSLASPVNQSIMELLVMADAAKRAAAERITAVIPFYAYGRTDRRHEPRVPITARLIADLITVSGVDRVLTIDLHASQIQGFFDIPVDELRSLSLFAREYFDRSVGCVVVAPHEGSTKWAKDLAERLDLPLAIIEKRVARDPVAPAHLKILGDVVGKRVILIENEVDTGGSIANAARCLVDAGALSVSAAATHAVLSSNVVERLTEAPIDEIVVTDSMPIREDVAQNLPIRSISVAPLLGEAIRRIHEGRPLDDLL
jgi:ribose-phosphate pyrophosphokinase